MEVRNFVIGLDLCSNTSFFAFFFLSIQTNIAILKQDYRQYACNELNPYHRVSQAKIQGKVFFFVCGFVHSTSKSIDVEMVRVEHFFRKGRGWGLRSRDSLADSVMGQCLLGTGFAFAINILRCRWCCPLSFYHHQHHVRLVNKKEASYALSFSFLHCLYLCQVTT